MAESGSVGAVSVVNLRAVVGDSEVLLLELLKLNLEEGNSVVLDRDDVLTLVVGVSEVELDLDLERGEISPLLLVSNLTLCLFGDVPKPIYIINGNAHGKICYLF